MIQRQKSIWYSNLILSDIPWEYYLHPCPIFYAKELSKIGHTLWINPPTRNPLKVRLFRPFKNLLIYTPWIFKRPICGLGFECTEVRNQIKLISNLVLNQVSSAWSISTAYEFLLEDFPSARSIFWSGDFFDPISEFDSYKNFDLVLCLTPPKFETIPVAFNGNKIHFNMSCDLNIFSENYIKQKTFKSLCKFTTNFSKTVGYIGTLSSRRLDYSLIRKLVEICSDINFVFVGKKDGLESTDKEIKELKKRVNVLVLEDVDYPEIPNLLQHFDVCLIPYKLNPANIGTCPNKFVEYCALGKPIVSTKLPGLTKFAELAVFGTNAEDFSFLIHEIFNNKRDGQIRLQKDFAEKSSASNFLTRINKILQIN